VIKLSEIDERISQLLSHLESIQNKDGSFDTMYLQPYYNPDKGWMKYAGNAPYETAASLIPLSYLSAPKATEITKQGIRFLVKISLDALLWTYSYPSKKELVPYDTDCTSLSSFVLTKNGYEVKNKEFLNSLINEHNNYPFYIWVNKFSRHLPFFTSLKMMWRNWKTRNSLNIINNILRLTDWEFSSSCINLLYIGKTPENQSVWSEIYKAFHTQSINYLYYIDLFHAFYFYTRLVGYGNHYELIDNKIILKRYISELDTHLFNNNNFQNRILFANSQLLSNYNLNENSDLFGQCFYDIKNEMYNNIFPFYSSNIETDYQPHSHAPNTYFGSPAITCSLYIEFLNLYRKRFYGSYYGQD
jgi:hypothetical protein